MKSDCTFGKKAIATFFLKFIIAINLIPFFCYSINDPDTLIHQGSVWKYLDDGSNQGTLWRFASFSDSAWASGPAEFGYGDNDEATVVSYGPTDTNKYITTYFRSTFNVSNISLYKGLRMYLKRDDGAVVYFNGTEVYRSNMPDGTISDTTLSSIAISGGAETDFIRVFLDISTIVNGNNLVAVEIHQADVTSSDISFNFSLLADTDAQISRGPYLQQSTPNSIYVRWSTSIPEVSKVFYGTSLAYTDSVYDSSLTYVHEVQLTGLSANTKYYYAVNSSSGLLAGDAETFFKTPPLPETIQPVRIWTMGDFGTGNVEQNQVRDAYYNYRGSDYTDLILWLGDNAYPSGTDEQYSYNVFTNHYESILEKSVVYSTMGNHELFFSSAVNQTGPYYDMFTFPKNGEAGGVASGTEAYYSFDYANIHFVCLESNIDSFGSANTNAMITWLNADLTATTQHWTIVYLHCPPYSRGYHDSDIYPDMIYVRENIVPVLESYRVDLVLSGHDHDYERSYLLNGHYGLSSTFNTAMIVDSGSGAAPEFYDKVSPNYLGTVYAVVGCGGGLEEVQTTWPHPAMFSSFDNFYGSMAIDVNGDTLTGRFITKDSIVADEFSILKHGHIGINENNNKNSLKVFPNPCIDKVNLYYAEFQKQKVNATVYDMMGKNIFSFDIVNNISEFDLKDFPTGIYLFKISGEDFLESVRVVKLN